MKNNNTYIKIIENNNKLNDIFFTTIMFLGSVGFLSVGICSYFNINTIGFLKTNEIIFFPQGLTMCFYGFGGLLISSYQVRY